MRFAHWLLLAGVLAASSSLAQQAPVPAGAPDGGAATTDPTPPTATPAGPAATQSVAPSEDPRFLIHTYSLVDKTQKDFEVIDGDTFHVRTLQGKERLRLILIDTEEVFHEPEANMGEAARKKLELMRTGFSAYVAEQKGDATHPIKYPTPIGEEAARFAQRFFEGASGVRLESDDPLVDGVAHKGNYGRTLCYVWATFKDAPPQLYNLEAVRAGMTPYFMKYGRSRRFDAAFRAAQAEAQAAKRGIWNPQPPPTENHYDDYAARLPWWERRAEALARYEQLRAKQGAKAPIALGDKAGIENVLSRIGQVVRVFGLVDEHDRGAVRLHDKGATLKVGGDQAIEVEIVGAELAEALQPARLHGEYVYVEGKLVPGGSEIPSKGKKIRYKRILVQKAAQIQLGHEVAVDGE